MLYMYSVVYVSRVGYLAKAVNWTLHSALLPVMMLKSFQTRCISLCEKYVLWIYCRVEWYLSRSSCTLWPIFGCTSWWNYDNVCLSAFSALHFCGYNQNSRLHVVWCMYALFLRSFPVRTVRDYLNLLKSGQGYCTVKYRLAILYTTATVYFFYFVTLCCTQYKAIWVISLWLRIACIHDSSMHKL